MMDQAEYTRRLKLLKPQYQDRLQKEHQELLATEIFTGTIPVNMPMYRQFAFMHTNELSLNVSLKYWKQMFHGALTSYSLTDIITFLSAAEPRTFREWLNTIPYTSDKVNSAVDEWIAFKEATKTMIEESNPIIEKHFNAVYEKLSRIQHLDLTGQTNSIPASHRK